MKISVLMIFSLVISSGCSQLLPVSGSGAIARLKPAQELADKKTYVPGDGLLFENELLSKQLDALILQGAELCYPATIRLARQREDRITHTLHNELDGDVNIDMFEQQQLLSQVERRLYQAKSSTGCQTDTTHVATLRSDNVPSTPAYRAGVAGDINTRLRQMTSSQYEFIQAVKPDHRVEFTWSANTDHSVMRGQFYPALDNSSNHPGSSE